MQFIFHFKELLEKEAPKISFKTNQSVLCLFKLSFYFNRIPIKKALSEYENRLNINDSTYQEFSTNKKWQIFNLHQEKNQFYRNFTGNKIYNNWEEIPVITKKHFQDIQGNYSNPYIKETDLIHGKTSGSSGVPLKYVRDKFSHALLWANIIYEYRKIGIEYGKSKQARFYGIPLEGLTYYKELLKDKFLNRDRFIVYDLSDPVLELFLNKFRKNEYDYIYGYTNSIVIFAKYLKKQGITLLNECVTLKLCIVTSEVCTPSDKLLLEEVLGIKVYNEYGSSEAAIIAFDNAEGDWILNDPLLFVEFVDAHGKTVKVGERGKIVVTSLDNKAMPIIRYEVGDWGVMSEKMNGKRRILKRLDGRLNDNLILPNGKIVPGFTLYYTTKALMDSLPGLKEYNIQQVAIDHLNFDLVIDNRLPVNEADLNNKLISLVNKYLNTKIKVTYRIVENLDRTRSGKAKHFVSLLN